MSNLCVTSIVYFIYYVDDGRLGEISLSGALRPVVQTENRLKEAQKLGFTTAIIPQQAKQPGVDGISLRNATDLAGVVEEVFGAR